MTDIEITKASAAGAAEATDASAAPVVAKSPEQLAGSAVVTIYSVYGMSCGHCASAVTREIGGIEGVTGVHVDLAAKQVTVGSTRRLAEDEVRAAVDEAGYELG
ncbi:MAG TPA: heavy-metal-associated domain-containing protein [Actinospica sp.]|jgi:copper chaperone CopZ|nr:heavy-metal-associated domain-containing protein [Actinospica sp.]